MAGNGVLCTEIYSKYKNIFDNVDYLPSQEKDIPQTTGVSAAEDKVSKVLTRSRSHRYHVQKYRRKYFQFLMASILD